jgi:hypothetical protein
VVIHDVQEQAPEPAKHVPHTLASMFKKALQDNKDFYIEGSKWFARFDKIIVYKHPEHGVIIEYSHEGKVLHVDPVPNCPFEGEITITDIKGSILLPIGDPSST